ncbi:response regulator [Pseudothauera lacus]|uniref:DNA-binding response regulator n=1 Tax=Pseudothauera lacus TaxID=2136175 RepID=A0A2T4IJ40_9RHOO|nr:response regulator transcription factor [Pseudothauera lacus]PTD97785.1 DNA-binding response regulator [Pseudothauera lacus]
MSARVLLVDDHALVRSGLRALIGGFAGFEVVGEAADGRAALALVEQLAVDVVVMDLSMPGLNGIEATRRLRAGLADCPVVVLSMHTEPDYLDQALAAGARAYVVKDAAPAELEAALRAALRGERFLSPQVAGRVGAAHGGSRTPLTARQREILRLIAEGCSTREIATRLHISVKTVETHRAQIMQRLDIFDIAGLTRYAMRTGLV